MRATRVSCTHPLQAARDLLLRADYAWQDKIQFNVINEFNCRGAYGTANDRIAPASRAQTWGARERTVA